MSNSTGDDNRGQVEGGDQLATHHPEVESSRDSSESSDSQSDSGDESGSSTGSGSDDQNQQGDTSVERSSGNEQQAAESDGSRESYKSLNASVAKSVQAEEKLEEPATPARIPGKVSSKSGKNKSPSKAELKTPVIPSKATASSGGNVKAASPVPVTPAKSLVFASPAAKIEIDFSEISGEVGEKAVTKQQPTLSREDPRSPGEVSSSDSTKPKAASRSGSVEPENTLKRTRRPSRSAIKEAQSPRTKRNKRDRADKAIARQSKSVEKVEEQVKLLQAQLDEVRSSGSGQIKRARKSDKHKSAKSKKSKKRSKSQSSDDGSSSSSVSDAPTTSSRIGKISSSRKLQGLAMERSKQLGALRQSEVHISEVAKALKIIKDTVFPTDLTQAYRKFHQVPGTGLPHIVKYVEELQDDLASFVRLTAKLNLELAHEFDLAKKQRIGPGADNEFLRIWQFSNDLTRAAVGSSQVVNAPKTVQAKEPEEDKATIELVTGDKKVNPEQQKKAVVVKAKEADVGKNKPVKKRKKTSSKTEEEA